MSSVKGSLLASTMLCAIAAAPGTLAQTATTAQPLANQSTASQTASHDAEVVVTGTRIKHSRAFTGPSPVTVISAEESQLAGRTDISQILQLSTVAANAVQINNNFSQFVTTGGPGANTLSLRGLGPQRTLLLIDGQRLGPAGVGGTVGPVDLNVIPSSIIDHVDILKDGASSIYGSDAIAGVVNIITKTKQNGGDLHFNASPSERGGGNTYEIDGGWGKTFDRGYVQFGFDFYRQDPLTYSQRPFLACETDNARFANGARADIIDPTTGKPKCYNVLTKTVIDFGSGYRYAPNASAVLGGGIIGADLPGWRAVNLGISDGLTAAQARLSHGQENVDTPLYGVNTAISPVARYTFTFNGSFDITNRHHLYASVLLNQRDSSQQLVGSFFTAVDPLNVYNTAGFVLPEPSLAEAAPSRQRVDYGRIVLGGRGDLPDFLTLNNWTYDFYGQFSRSDGSYKQRFAYNDRVNATAGSETPGGCDVNAIAPGGSGMTMAEAEPGVACVPVDYFTAAQTGHFTQAEANFLHGDQTGRTTYNHYYVEGTVSGDVFNLPAGPLGASLGFHLRREELNDLPGPAFVASNVYNFTTAGQTKGSDTIEEVFGELQIPVVQGLPLVKRLDTNLSGRYSHYKSYGSSATYKFGADWQVTDWFTVRGSHSTGFRAPELYELFLADQISFLDQLTVDPCQGWATSGVSLNIQKNCASQGLPGNLTGGSGATIFTGGGGGRSGRLKAETSIADTIGFVLVPKWFGLDLRLSVEYYSTTIDNQIQNFGAFNIVNQCYNSPSFPGSPFCSLFTRDLTPGTSEYQHITDVQDNYVNVAKEMDQGLDVEVYYSTKLPKNVLLMVDSQLAWSFYTNTILLNGSTNNYLGQVGQPGFNGNINFRFDRGPWTFNYLLYMIGHSSDDPFVSNVDTNFRDTGQTVYLNHVVPFYTTSTISLRRKFDTFSIDVGVKNLFDKDPPTYSAEGFQSLLGTTPVTSQYDLVGRTFFIDFNEKF